MKPTDDAQTVDGTVFPRLAAYLGRLPRGLGSYPRCRAKGSLVRTALDGHDLGELGGGLPHDVLRAIHDPPAAGVWVSAVLADAVFYAMCDAFYPTEQAMLEWTFARTVAAANSRLYRAFTRVAGPRSLLRITATVHGLFQRGTSLAAGSGADGVVLTLRHPAHLHGGWNHLSNVAMFRGILDTTRARAIDVEMVSSEPERAVYRAVWREPE